MKNSKKSQKNENFSHDFDKNVKYWEFYPKFHEHKNEDISSLRKKFDSKFFLMFYYDLINKNTLYFVKNMHLKFLLYAIELELLNT